MVVVVTGLHHIIILCTTDINYSTICAAPIQLAGGLGGEKVLCSSDSYHENLENPSPFCTLIGTFVINLFG